jgi:outer membrane lipoprotein SlyB
MRMRGTLLKQTAWVALCAAAAISRAQSPSSLAVYPAKGQSDAQMSKDRGECYTWATTQTGYDPVKALQQQQARAAQPSYVAPPPGGQVARSTVIGAGGGAAIGAIAGDAGKGAAIGAVTGLLVGAVRRRQAEDTQQQAQAQLSAQQNHENEVARQKLAHYTRTWSACMEGRGYSVK